jgi:transcriptional regulator of heat shock response
MVKNTHKKSIRAPSVRGYKYYREAFTKNGDPRNGGHYKTLKEATDMAHHFYDNYGFINKIYRKEYGDNGKMNDMILIKTIGGI